MQTMPRRRQMRGPGGFRRAVTTRYDKYAGHALAGLALASGARRAYSAVKSAVSGLGTGAKPPGTKVYKAKKVKAKRKPKTKGQKLAKQVRHLQKQVNANTSTLKYKSKVFGSVKASANQCAYIAYSITTSSLETVLQNLRYFDPSAPGTYKTVDFTTGTQSKSVEAQFYSKIELRNNYKVPVIVDVYCVVPKQDTNITPDTAVSNGLTDLGISSASTEVQCFPTESPQFRDLYKIVKHSQVELQPNLAETFSWSSDRFDYDPSIVDSHNQTFQKEMRSQSWLIRVMGIVAHDSSVLTEISQAPCGVDFVVNRHYTIKYPGGADFEYMIVSTNGAAFTNGANVSMPTVSQIQYGL